MHAHDLRAVAHSHVFAEEGRQQRERALTAVTLLTLVTVHVWQVGAQAWCAALSVVADSPLPAASYRQRPAALEPLRHVTVGVHRCPAASPA